VIEAAAGQSTKFAQNASGFVSSLCLSRGFTGRDGFVRHVFGDPLLEWASVILAGLGSFVRIRLVAKPFEWRERTRDG
jgi:hypothetical protein